MTFNARVEPGRCAPARPRRLLLVADSLDVGGAERHVVGLGGAIVRAGYAVTVACSIAGPLTLPAQQAGLTVRPLLSHLVKRRLSLVFAWRLARLVRQERFDLVHAHMYASAAASALATLATNVPLVLTEHSEARWRTGQARWLSRRIYRRAAHVIAVSNRIRRRLIDEDGVPPTRITVIPNALSPLPARDSDLALSVLAGEPAGPIVGLIARLQPEKGVTYFLEAAARVAQEVPEARFVVVGDGPLRHELARLAEQLGIHERVHFLGFQVEAPALVGAFDVLVVPSLSEGTPLVILEAMAAGVPVVASAVGGIPEQITHGREGLLVRPGDSSAFGAAILSLLRNPEWARRLGEAGRQRVADCFSHDRMVRQTEAVYRAALHRAHPNGLAPGEPALPTPP